MGNKSLIKYSKENIFNKIINFFKKIFKKDNIVVEQEEKDQKAFKNKEEDFIKSISVINNQKPENEKERFFKLYNRYKAKMIRAEDLNMYDVIRINRMLEEELKLNS